MQSSVNIEFINPFIVGASTVYKELFNAELKKGKIDKIQNIEPTHDVVINIDVQGAMNGFVFYSMTFHTVTKIADVLVPGLTEDQIKSEYKDIIGELANMITGKAFTILQDKDVHLSTPLVMDKNDFKISGFNKFIGILIKLYSPVGQLEIGIIFK